MADPRRATFLLYAAFTLLALARGAAPQEPGGHASKPAQKITVTVTDRQGNFVRGLKAEDFGVIDGDRPQPLVYFSHEEGPASIGILLDASASMTGERTRKTCEALAEFVAAAHASNEYFLLAFNQSPQMLVEPSSDRAAVAAALARVAETERRGRTALFDAVYLAVDKAAYGRHPRRVLLVVTDGMDTLSAYTFKQVRRALAESDVTFYAVNVGYEHHSDPSFGANMMLE